MTPRSALTFLVLALIELLARPPGSEPDGAPAGTSAAGDQPPGSAAGRWRLIPTDARG